MADPDLIVLGKVYHLLLLVVHLELSSKKISVLIMFIIIFCCALSFTWEGKHMLLPNKSRNYVSPENQFEKC